MNNPLMKWLALPIMVSLLGAGCGSTPSPTGSSGAPGSPVASSGSGRCMNLYYPLEAGSKIVYKMRTGDQNIPFTISVLEHDADTIKLEYAFVVQGREAKITNEMVCENGTIKGKGHFDFASAFLGIDLRYEVLEMTGEIMPATLRVGTAWTMTNKVKAIVTGAPGPIGQMMNGRISSSKIESKVVGEESVTVPAGTFRALKIEQKVTSSGDIGGRAYSNTATNYAWYVKDVGMVKSQSGEGASGFVMEAQTITP